MNESNNTMNSMLSKLRPLAAATTLALASITAQATLVNFTGYVDSGPLAGSTFSGSFSYADPAPQVDFVFLDSFALEFFPPASAKLSFSLASADTDPVALFAAGSFIGIDYTDLDSFDIGVSLLAGFSELSEAQLSYFNAISLGSEIQGFGSINFVTVPEPSTLGLVLAGLLISGRRRKA